LAALTPEATRRFEFARRRIYRYLATAQKKGFEPKARGKFEKQAQRLSTKSMNRSSEHHGRPEKR
jgi:hypothetical protein